MKREIISESHEGSYCQDFKSYQPDKKAGVQDSWNIKNFEIENPQNQHDIHTGRYRNQIEFWLSCLGYAVGYGNIWRFPYMLYRNGGGTFLIPWAVCIIIIVLPLSYLEISYGQLYRRAVHRYFDTIHPRLLGLSFAVNSIVYFIAIYYMCLIAWCLTFFFYSFKDPLPWAPQEGSTLQEAIMNNHYFSNEFLRKSEGLFDIHSYSLWLMLSMIIVMGITFAIIYEGLDTARYTVYFIVPLPYVLITILFIKGLTLDGNYLGWIYLFKPDWSHLFTFQIWSDAAAQVLFSAGLAQNTFMKFGNHKKDGEPLLLSTICIPLLNFATSIYAGLALFAFVGHISKQTGVPIEDMPIKGMELCFVVYPNLLNTLPWPRLWSIIIKYYLILIIF